jgi:hypothetical protein
MPNVYMPKRQQSGQGLGLIGMGVGAAFGGPAGAAAGQSLGSTIGGMANSNQPQQPMQVATNDQNAMQRRMAANQDDHLQALRDAYTSLPQLPPDAQQEYARPIMTAYVAEAKKRGVNPWEGV